MANKPNYNKKSYATTPKGKTGVKINENVRTSLSREDHPLTMPSYFTKKNNIIIFAIIVLLSFGIYANSIPNLYCLDDGIVVTKNNFTKKGIGGLADIFHYDTMAGEHGKDVNFVEGGRYRPLSVALLAIEYEIFGENPHVSHAVNIILYAITGIFVFLVFAKLFSAAGLQPFEERWYFSIPFLAAVLYIAHPIHTEAVANIKGRDEIMTMLGAFIAMWFSLKYLDEYKVSNLWWSALAFFCAMLSKENAITFLAIIPLSIWFFTNKSLKSNFKTWLPLFGVSILFIIIRRIVIGPNATGTAHELMNNPFVYATDSQHFATIFYTLWMYIKLMIFPHPLTWDYYPYHIALVDWDDAKAYLPLLLYVAMGLYGLITIRKKNNIWGFAIWLYLATISIVSNLFFTIGVFMSERFIFISSLGFSLVLAYFLVVQLPKLLENYNVGIKNYKLFLIPFLFIVMGLYSFKTIERNFDWKDNYTLFTTDALVSKNSAKSLTTAGEQYVLKGMDIKDAKKAAPSYKMAKEYLLRAIKIHPKYIAALLDLGIVYEKYDKNLDSAIFYYSETIRLKPDYDKAFNNIAVIFTNKDTLQLKLKTYKQLAQYNPNRFDVNYYLGSLYGAVEHDLPNAIKYLEKAIQLDQSKAPPFIDLGVAYGNSGNFTKAIQAFEVAAKINPKDPLIYRNLAESYRITKNPQKEKECRDKAAKAEADILAERAKQQQPKK